MRHTHTLKAVEDLLKTELYKRETVYPYITIERMTAIALLDLVEDAISREEQNDGA